MKIEDIRRMAQDVRGLSKIEMADALHLIDYSGYGGHRARNFAVL